jgi:hypothetical protein
MLRTGVDSVAAGDAHVARVVATAAPAARVVPHTPDTLTGAVLHGAHILARNPEASQRLAAILHLAAPAVAKFTFPLHAALVLQSGVAVAVLLADRLAALAREGALAGSRASLHAQIRDRALCAGFQSAGFARHVRADGVDSGAINGIDSRANEPGQKNECDCDQKMSHSLPPLNAMVKEAAPLSARRPRSPDGRCRDRAVPVLMSLFVVGCIARVARENPKVPRRINSGHRGIPFGGRAACPTVAGRTARASYKLRAPGRRVVRPMRCR